jgi:nitroreductase
MKYVSVYPWWVIDAIKKGHKVYVLDRKLKTVHVVNSAPIQDVVAVTESEEKDRYEFWYEEETLPEYEVDNG